MPIFQSKGSILDVNWFQSLIVFGPKPYIISCSLSLFFWIQHRIVNSLDAFFLVLFVFVYCRNCSYIFFILVYFELEFSFNLADK